ncbi:hypothetical protein NC653_026625 [Populus alba x Populus x berolinensis]|uniref:Uncharacterized protein n=1 Tax=Populus alba x Populus x berolinensis TaxID=444605 RepID=A0AAD6MEI4_9ROSI|nr:hypothetical protein NC653_026625 [Populus alba x Populus x berolinensis]
MEISQLQAAEVPCAGLQSICTKLVLDYFVCPPKINPTLRCILTVLICKRNEKVSSLMIINMQLPQLSCFNVQPVIRMEKGNEPCRMIWKRIKGFAKECTIPFRERLKSLCFPRPQQEFFKFTYLGKDLKLFRDRLKHGIANVGLTIQAQKLEELGASAVLCGLEQVRFW